MRINLLARAEIEMDESAFYYDSQSIAPMRRFPFLIIYKIDRDDLYVASVFHTRRNPSNKPK